MGKGCIRESKGIFIVGRSIHGFVGCELLIAVIVTLATTVCAVVGWCGW